MRSFATFAAAAVVAFPLAIAAPNKPGVMDANYYQPDQVVDVDVVIIGGGAAGAYSAIQLKDQGKKVMLVESKDRLGGHTETYHDPESGASIDIGVKLYHDEPLVHQWFARFNLSISPIDLTRGFKSEVADLRTGMTLQGLPATNASAQAAALQRYAAAIAQYPELDRGFFLPEKIPEELYKPFSKFVEKYNLADAVQTIFEYNAGSGDILNLPAIQQIRTFSLSLLATFQKFQSSSVQDNSLLYERLTAELKAANSVLLSSKVTKTERVSKSGCGGVKVLVETPNGYRLIRAKKILMAIPPTPENLINFDPSGDELKLFKQFKSAGYFTSVVRNAGPVNTSITNISPETPYALPAMPAIYNINPTANPNLSIVYYGTQVEQQHISDDEAKAAILEGVNRFRNANKMTGPKPEIVAFSNHSPFNLMVDGEAIRNGFYKDLYAIQAKRNTFWASATLKAHDSSSLWAYISQIVLPQLIESL